MQFFSGKNYFLTLIFLSIFSNIANALENIVHWQTAGGLKVYWVYSPSPAMVDIELLFAAGSAYDGEKTGLANATNSMFYEYADGQPQAYWAEKLETLGAEIAFNSRRESANIRLRTLSDDDTRNEALDLWLKIISKAEFRQEDWQRVREQLLSLYRDQQQDPSYLANQTFYQTLFPDSALGQPSLGTEKSLMALSVEDLKGFYEKFYHRHNAKLVIVGNLNRQQAEAVAEKVSAALADNGKAAPEVRLTRSQSKQEIIYFPSQQAHLILGYVTIPRTHPDYYPLLVANHLLGGNGFSSRLMQKLRVEHGLTYGIYSYIIPMRQGSIFSIRLQTRVEQSEQALTLIQETLNNLRQEGFSDSEFNDAKANLINSFPLSISSNRSILRQVGSIAFYDLELDRLNKFQNTIRAISQAEVKEAIEKYLLPDALITIQVGTGQ